MRIQNRSRGKARHWIIGCLLVILFIVAGIVGGGYYLFKKSGWNTFDVSAKLDPPITASAESVLPLKVNVFERVELTTDTAKGSAGPWTTTAGAKALYRNELKESYVTVIAAPTNQMKQEGGGTGPDGRQMPKFSSSNQDMGMSMKIPFGTENMEWAMWGKKNWSFVVVTTSTPALNFAKEFMPAIASEDETTTGN